MLCAAAAASLALPGAAQACGVTGLSFQRAVGETNGTLSWQAPPGSRPQSYEVYRDGRLVGETAGRAIAVEARPGHKYVFTVRVVDESGETSPCVARLAQAVRFHVPFRPSGLAVTDAGNRQVRLVWSRAAPGDGRVVAYRVFRDGRPFKGVPGLSLRMRVPRGRPHGFQVAATDTRGNVGPRSNRVKVLEGHHAPRRPQRLRSTRVGDSDVSLSWSASARGNGHIAGYRIYRNGLLVRQVRGRRGSDHNLAPATSYRYTVAAIDTQGYMSAFTGQVSISTARPGRTRGRAHAFLLASTSESFRDLQRHYRQIGTVYPTYFDCGGAGGDIAGRDDPLITRWSQLRGIRVLPRFNCQDPVPLHAILTDQGMRDATISGLAALVRRNGYEGINLDFENGLPSDRDALTAFVARLAAQLHAIGKRLAVEVSARFEPTTVGRSAIYDYEALGKTADNVFVMNWGWHWSTSDPGAPDDIELCRKVADYVASMPNRKRFVLGTHMYGMDWANGGGPANEATALEHADVEALLARYGAKPVLDPAADAWVFTYTDGAGAHHEVWYPDASTIARRVQLARDRGLGIGFWRLGREDQGVWSDPLIAPGSIWP